MSAPRQVESGLQTELVLPPAEGLRRLESLRRAEAWRLLREHAARGELRTARALADLARRDSEAAVDVLMDPANAVLARAGHAREAAEGWALELARRGELHARVEVGGRLISRALGRAISIRTGVRGRSSRSADAAQASVTDGYLEIAGGGAPPRSIALSAAALDSAGDPRLEVEDHLRELGHGIRFALADSSPLAMLEAHPDKHGNALDLGGRPEAEWVRSLREAIALVERHLPRVLDELEALSMLVLPVGHEPEKHLSASYREYVGALYLTLHPNVTTLAEALVHEHQHNKANLASYHDPLIENGFETMVRSPVRPDLRPLWGVLLAVHAFVPAAELYRRMMEAGDARVRGRLGDVIARNDEGLRTLRAHARPTRIGARLLEELDALHREHLALDLSRPEGVAWEG